MQEIFIHFSSSAILAVATERMPLIVFWAIKNNEN